MGVTYGCMVGTETKCFLDGNVLLFCTCDFYGFRMRQDLIKGGASGCLFAFFAQILSYAEENT